MSANPLDYRCPACSAEPGKRCRTRRTGRTTDIHQARWDAVPLTAAWRSQP